MTRALMLLTATALLLATGCGASQKAEPPVQPPVQSSARPSASPSVLAASEDPSDAESVVPIRPLVAKPCDPGETGDGAGRCVPCKDYEGCFDSSDDMDFFYGQIIDLVQEYADTAVPGLAEPDQWWFVPVDVSGEEGCTDENGDRATYTDQSYEYCPFDRSVYVGEALMWDFYKRLGDAAPAVGIAHEWGHHLQSEAGVRVRTRQDVIAAEDQADCAAGAWSGWLVEQDVMNDDDFEDVGRLLVEIGSEEGPDRDHGTVSERGDSFLQGFEGGLTSCSSFFPDAPLV